jgi:hypothetical protein
MARASRRFSPRKQRDAARRNGRVVVVETRNWPQGAAGQDTSRGLAMLIAGAVMVLLKWVLPPVAPLVVAAYGIYQAVHRRYGEGLAAVGVAVVLWYARGVVGWLLWLVGAAFVAAGLFFLIRSMRESA